MNLQNRIEKLEQQAGVSPESCDICAHGWVFRDSCGLTPEQITAETPPLCAVCGLPKRMMRLVDAEETEEQ